MRLVDCDTLESEIDFYGVYSWGTTPFLDPPEGSGFTVGSDHRDVSPDGKGCPVCPVEPED